jgi:uncharacterized protein YutE (UPF0331/DUF86 family)
MVDRNLMATKLGELSDRVARVRLHCPSSADGLRGDRDALDLVSFNLMLAVQSCLDVASHLIADEGWVAPRTLGEAFQRLEEQGVISAQVAAALARAVGLRNVVAHGYAGVDPAMVFMAATAGLADLDGFAREVANWVARP